MDILGVTIPLWALFIGVIIFIIIAWKLIKFAIKLLLILIFFFTVLFCLDYFNVFNMIMQLFS